MSKPVQAPAKKLQEKTPTVVSSVAMEGYENPIIAAFDGGLESVSVGVVKNPGTNEWVSFKVFLKGTTVAKIEVEEPNMRQIAEETAKINFVHTFMAEEL